MTGDPLRGFTYSDYEVRKTYEFHPVSILGRLTKISLAFDFWSFLGIIPLLYYLKKTFKDKNFVFLYSMFTLIMFLLPMYKLLTGTLNPTYRYFLLSAILFTPFYYQIFQGAMNFFKAKKLTIVFYLSLATMLLVLFKNSYQWINHEFPLKFEEGLKQTAYFVKIKIGREKKIFLDKHPSKNNAQAWSINGWYAYANRMGMERCHLPGLGSLLGRHCLG